MGRFAQGRNGLYGKGFERSLADGLAKNDELGWQFCGVRA